MDQTNETQPITGSGTAEQSNEQIQATVADTAEHSDPNGEVTTNAPVETEPTAGLYGVVATGTAPLLETIPVAVETTSGPFTLQPVGEQILTGTAEHHSLLAEIEAMGESLEASLAEALRTRCAALRRALGL